MLLGMLEHYHYLHHYHLYHLYHLHHGHEPDVLRMGMPTDIPIIDTMIQGRWATPDGAVPNLEALCFACNVEYDRNKAHGATYDVSVMMACFFKQYERGFFTLPSSPYVYKPAAKAAH